MQREILDITQNFLNLKTYIKIDPIEFLGLNATKFEKVGFLQHPKDAGQVYIGEISSSIFSKDKPRGLGILFFMKSSGKIGLDELKIRIGRNDGW